MQSAQEPLQQRLRGVCPQLLLPAIRPGVKLPHTPTASNLMLNIGAQLTGQTRKISIPRPGTTTNCTASFFQWWVSADATAAGKEPSHCHPWVPNYTPRTEEHLASYSVWFCSQIPIARAQTSTSSPHRCLQQLQQREPGGVPAAQPWAELQGQGWMLLRVIPPWEGMLLDTAVTLGPVVAQEEGTGACTW